MDAINMNNRSHVSYNGVWKHNTLKGIRMVVYLWYQVPGCVEEYGLIGLLGLWENILLKNCGGNATNNGYSIWPTN